MNIQNRAFTVLNLNQYSINTSPDEITVLDLKIPSEKQYILRMLIKRMFGEYVIPYELEWVRPLIELCDSNQKLMGIKQPFVYITIRNGLVNSVTDDEWHVDGFSQTITHLPEQNYIWCNEYPTEYTTKLFSFPNDFDGLKHNIHLFFQDNILDKDILLMNKNTVYCLDPYVVHRRSFISNNKNRCFVRLSFTPIEIEDINNTINPLLITNYKRDGIKEMRNKLIKYGNTNTY